MDRGAARRSLLGLGAALGAGAILLLLTLGVGGASAKHPAARFDKYYFRNLTSQNAWRTRVVFEHDITMLSNGWPESDECEMPHSESRVIKCVGRPDRGDDPIRPNGKGHPDEFWLKVDAQPPRTHVEVDHWYWEDENGDRIGMIHQGCDKVDGCRPFFPPGS